MILNRLATNAVSGALRVATSSSRGCTFSTTSASHAKVAVLGAAGGIGQPLSLLCKLSPEITELSCYDIVGTPGVAADLSHIPTYSSVTGSLPSPVSFPMRGNVGLEETLSGADVVVIPAGVPRKPGMTRDDLFNTNAGIVKTLVEGCAKFCPDAMIAIISNPVNSTVPIAAEVLKKAGVYDKRKLLGVTTLDVVRAKTFYAEKKGLNVAEVDVPVVGGHAGVTILPLFSQATPKVTLTKEELDALTKRTQDGGTEVVEAKQGKGSATLSMAYAAALFADSCLRGLNGQPTIECTYVESNITDAAFFASKCKLSTEGVEKVYDLGVMTDYEKACLKAMMPELTASIKKGVDFAKAV